jgi:hypothetical protein
MSFTKSRALRVIRALTVTHGVQKELRAYRCPKTRSTGTSPACRAPDIYAMSQPAQLNVRPNALYKPLWQTRKR